MDDEENVRIYRLKWSERSFDIDGERTCKAYIGLISHVVPTLGISISVLVIIVAHGKERGR